MENKVDRKNLLTVNIDGNTVAKHAYETVADILEEWADEGRSFTLKEMREKAAELRKLADEL